MKKFVLVMCVSAAIVFCAVIVVDTGRDLVKLRAENGAVTEKLADSYREVRLKDLEITLQEMLLKDCQEELNNQRPDGWVQK